jgi:hypothetical protein
MLSSDMLSLIASRSCQPSLLYVSKRAAASVTPSVIAGFFEEALSRVHTSNCLRLLRALSLLNDTHMTQSAKAHCASLLLAVSGTLQLAIYMRAIWISTPLLSPAIIDKHMNFCVTRIVQTSWMEYNPTCANIRLWPQSGNIRDNVWCVSWSEESLSTLEISLQILLPTDADDVILLDASSRSVRTSHHPDDESDCSDV